MIPKVYAMLGGVSPSLGIRSHQESAGIVKEQITQCHSNLHFPTWNLLYKKNVMKLKDPLPMYE